MPAPRTCIICESSYEPKTGTQVCCSELCQVERAKAQWRERQTFRHQRNCLRCGTLMAPRTLKDGNKLYCSDACKFTPLEPVQDVAEGAPCAHCSRLFVKTHSRQKYCGVPCRVGAFKAKEAATVEGDDVAEIEVRDLDDAPRRARIARLFAIYNGDGGDGFAPAFTPTRFANPADRRAGR
jgi:hypothetical protein